MSYKILTINREFESAGSEIAQAVADRLNLPYYDRFLISSVVDEHGIKESSAVAADEKLASRFEYSRAQAAHYYTASMQALPTNAQLAYAQFDLIRKVADEGPCLIVGRCGSHILRKEGKDVVSVYIHASQEQRIRRAMDSLSLSEKEAAKVVKQTDKARNAYHKNYTGYEWSDPNQYNMVLNTDLVPFDTCVDLICALYQAHAAD
mgnify:CR=1 FL=1